jgi:putative ABC transport system substrate-binding protein
MVAVLCAGRKPMRRREFVALLGGFAAGCPITARAQQPDRIRRIGVLIAVAETDPDVRKGLSAFLSKLGEFGWREHENFLIEYRWGGGDVSRIEAFAKELVDLRPDILLAAFTPPVVALMKQTRSIPIVFLTVTDPVGQGLVASLARPGGNVTGFSDFEISLGAKMLQLLRDIAPRATRTTIIFNPATAPYYDLYLRAIQEPAASFNIEPIPVQIHSERDFEPVIAAAAREPGGGLFVLPDSFNIVNRKRIIELAARNRLPAIYYFRYFAMDGGLISYGPDAIDLFVRAAGYVDRILHGAEPGTLPVQQPNKFDLVVNLGTDRLLDLLIPQDIISRADEVIQYLF